MDCFRICCFVDFEFYYFLNKCLEKRVMPDKLITIEETEHLDKLLDTPIFDDEDLIELAKEFDGDE